MTLNKLLKKTLRTAHGFYNLGKHTYKLGKWAYKKYRMNTYQPKVVSTKKTPITVTWKDTWFPNPKFDPTKRAGPGNRQGKWQKVGIYTGGNTTKIIKGNPYKAYMKRFKPYKRI